MNKFLNIIRVVRAARKCEEYLWGIYNDEWGFEEWKRMLAKRVHKIIKIDLNNPHWKIELKKRILQNACVSIALLERIDTLKEGIHPYIPSNLDFYEPKVRKCEKIE